jgi:hypothetical protein
VTRKHEILTPEERAKLLNALHGIRTVVQWKSGKDIMHLKKRQKMKHLPLSASLLDYHEAISALIGNEQNIIYLYEFRGTHYYAVRGFLGEKEWLVIFGTGGVMETAFPPENIDHYLEHRGFVPLGRIEEVLKWTE